MLEYLKLTQHQPIKWIRWNIFLKTCRICGFTTWRWETCRHPNYFRKSLAFFD